MPVTMVEVRQGHKWAWRQEKPSSRPTFRNFSSPYCSSSWGKEGNQSTHVLQGHLILHYTSRSPHITLSITSGHSGTAGWKIIQKVATPFITHKFTQLNQNSFPTSLWKHGVAPQAYNKLHHVNSLHLSLSLAPPPLKEHCTHCHINILHTCNSYVPDPLDYWFCNTTGL